MSKQRKIRFIIFILIFLAVSPVILMYSFGNLFSKNGFFKTGGIYVVSPEPDCEIYLDGKLKKTSGFFQRSFLIKNLSPRSYLIQVKKDGLNPWTKEVFVFDGLVTEANAFMLPEKVELREITKIITSVDEKGTTTKKNLEYDSILKLFSQKENSISKKQINSVINSTSTYPLGTKNNHLILRNVELWSENNKIFAFWSGKETATPESFCYKLQCSNLREILDYSSDIKKVDFFLGDTDIVLASSNNCIFAIEVEQNKYKKSQNIYCGDKADFFVEDNNYLYIKDGNLLYEAVL